MTEHEPLLEQDGRFPSGPWTGFFLQRPSTTRHWMELRLTFRGGALRGDGHDWVGTFTLDGHYDLTDGRCWWIKRYVRQHEVSYAGHNEGKGIWGVWEIPPRGRGGFHIWPAGMADPTQQARTTEEHAPVEATSRRGLATPTGPSAGRYLPPQAAGAHSRPGARRTEVPYRIGWPCSSPETLRRGLASARPIEPWTPTRGRHTCWTTRAGAPAARAGLGASTGTRPPPAPSSCWMPGVWRGSSLSWQPGSARGWASTSAPCASLSKTNVR